MDLFENEKQEVVFPPAQESSFPDFNSQWIPPFEEGISSKTGRVIEKGTDIFKKASGFYFALLGLTALVIFLPAFVRVLYGLSKWLFEMAEIVFP